MGRAVDQLAIELVKLPESEWQRLRAIHPEVGAEPSERLPSCPDTVSEDETAGNGGNA